MAEMIAPTAASRQSKVFYSLSVTTSLSQNVAWLARFVRGIHVTILSAPGLVLDNIRLVGATSSLALGLSATLDVFSHTGVLLILAFAALFLPVRSRHILNYSGICLFLTIRKAAELLPLPLFCTGTPYRENHQAMFGRAQLRREFPIPVSSAAPLNLGAYRHNE